MRCSNFLNLFWNRTLHVSDSFSVHHHESSTAHIATGVCHAGFADCLLVGSGCIWEISASRWFYYKNPARCWELLNPWESITSTRHESL